MKKYIAVIAGVVISLGVIAQELEDHDQKHDHFHANEIGISFSPVYFQNSKTMAFGLHSHYVKRIGDSRFGIGLGAEYIFGEARHQTYSAVFQYSPTYRIHLVVSPGVAPERELAEFDQDGNDHEHHGAVFALHLEAIYEFHIGEFDLGPSFEFAYDPSDIHLSLGLHLAYPF